MLRDLSEYLWRFTPYNNADHVALASEPGASIGVAHMLTLASLERAVGGTSCDRVTVRDTVLSVDSVTGLLQRQTVFAREFGVRQGGGLLVGC